MRSLVLAVVLVGSSSFANPLSDAARQAWMLAFVRGGDVTVARAELAVIAAKPADVRPMMMKLADLFEDAGKDRDAAFLWNDLYAEAPGSNDAALAQAHLVLLAMRAESRPVVARQVDRLVETFQRVTPPAEAKDLAERALSSLAIGWHREKPDVGFDEATAATDGAYRAYLTLFPESPKAYALRFFWAEFLYDQRNDYARAAEQYTAVLMADVRARESGGTPGPYMEKAAFNAVLASEAVVQQAELRQRTN